MSTEESVGENNSATDGRTEGERSSTSGSSLTLSCSSSSFDGNSSGNAGVELAKFEPYMYEPESADHGREDSSEDESMVARLSSIEW